MAPTRNTTRVPHHVPHTSPVQSNPGTLSETKQESVDGARFEQLIQLIGVADLTPWQARLLTDAAATRV